MKLTIHKALAVVTLALVLSMPAATAFANGASSAEAAIDIALQRNGGNGKILSVRERDSDGGRSYFMIKILQDGKVRIFKVEKE